MQILNWETFDEPARRAALARPQMLAQPQVMREAQELIDSVRRLGDMALIALTRRFDDVALDSLRVSSAEFARARAAVTPAQTAALERAITNVRAFHEPQRPKPFSLQIEPGVHCEQLIQPIGSVGLYVPAGSAPLPSTVIMLAVPAQIAGCPERIVCTPPRSDGSAHPAVLRAAELCGIDTVFKVGGAQAIAALAYGTQSVPQVDKIFGPGNAWVTAAKQLVAQDPAGALCELPAGPSEALILADETARADFVAADLLAQAEHDIRAHALLVTTSCELAAAVAESVAAFAPKLPRHQILAQSLQACRGILVPDLHTGLAVVNAYAPEHLLLQVREPRRCLAGVRAAGSVFLGAYSPEPLGDYCTGANHVLPTYGYARALSGLSVRDFVKTITVQELSVSGLLALGPTAVALAELEGLDAHAQAVTLRLDAIARDPP